jgi:hypothetical protein
MVSDKRAWPKPAAWAIAQNERKWSEFDAVADRCVIVDWSLADDYRTHMMKPGDRSLFWVTGRNGGIARIGFLLSVTATPRARWKDAQGKWHKEPYSGRFFMPPFPNRRYIHRSVFADDPKMAECELLGTAGQRSAPLRIEPSEWRVIERRLRQFDRTNVDFRAAWE